MKHESKNKSDINLIYGRIPVRSSIESNKVKRLLVQNGFSDDTLLRIAKEKGLKVEFVDQHYLNSISKGGNHQGIVAEVEEFKYSSLEEILKGCKDKKQPLILILDEIADPHNLGAIIRSCDAFGVDGIILKNRNQVRINMTVVKVSTGAIDHVKICQVSNISNAIRVLKDSGFWIYSSDGSAKVNYDEVKYDRPTALVVGSEGNGISKLVLENSDFVVKIPMLGHVNSLNVSVATGVLLSNIRSSNK